MVASSATETTSTTNSTAGSVLVNVADDAHVRLLRLLVLVSTDDDAAAFSAKCTIALEQNDASALIQLLLNTPSVVQRIGTLANLEAPAATDEEARETATGTVALLAGLLVQAMASSTSKDATRTSTTVFHKLLENLLDAITKHTTTDESTSTSNDKQHQMQLLTVLYNILPEPSLASDSDSKTTATTTTTSPKCMILVRLLQTSASSLTPTSPLGRWILGSAGASASDKQQQQPFVLTQLIAHWSSHDRSNVYQTVCTVLQDQKDYQSQRQQYLCLLLAEDAPNHTDVARQVVIGAIQHPVTLFQPSPHRHLLQPGSPVLQQLAQAEPALVQLLRLLQLAQWPDYPAFVQSHGTRMTQDWGLDLDQCEHHVRMLRLCSIATATTTASSESLSTSETNAIPYATIRDQLQVSTDAAVESLVVDAVQNGYLQAKLDPVSHTVWIQQCVLLGSFAATTNDKGDVTHLEQWKQLQQRLSVWKTNVGHMLEALQEAQQQQAGQ